MGKYIVLFLMILFLGACASDADLSDDNAAVEPTIITETAVVPTNTPDSPPTPKEVATAVITPEETVVMVAIPDDEIPEILDELLDRDTDAALAALNRVKDSKDQRFVSVLLELMRAREIGLIQNLNYSPIVNALESLSGQDLGQDWAAWVEWYGATDLEPPPGFTTWKGQILAGIDPGFGEFLQDEHPANLRPEEILWGGVRVDGIPALDYPTMVTPAEAEYLNPWDVVFGIAINGDAHAYPLRILDWHEMANAVVGDVPVSLAYCTLCGAAIAYDGRSTDANGDPVNFDFGSSGFLYRSNKLMYDRQTRTLWNQLTGEPVLGELVGTDVQLNLLPVVLTTWDAWQAQHPQTVVVDINTGYPRDYTSGAAYGNYFAYEDTMFPVWQRDDARQTKDQIYALNINDTPKAYPIDILTAAQVVNDELAGTNLVLVSARGLLAVEGENQYVGNVNYQAGSEVRAFERSDHIFKLGSDADTLISEDGSEWKVTEEALVSATGETLPRINGHLAFWFGWYAFYPETLVYE